MKSYLRKKFINWLVKGLFNGLQAEDILRIIPPNTILYKGKRLTEEQIDTLQGDAEKFHESTIWKLLSDDAKYNADCIMYETSKDFEGMMFGKAVLYAVDILEKRMRQLSKLKK